MKNCIKLHTGVRVLNVAFDVSLDTLNWHTDLGDHTAEGELSNTTAAIVELLQQLEQLARQHGWDEVRVVCESTGHYHRSLLRLAANRGMRTGIVNGEAVAKMRVIESNDTGKTDIKDPRVILTVALIGRLQVHRLLDETWSCLREWHQLLCTAEEKMSAAKNELHHAVKLLFPDLKLSKSVLFGPTGRALIEQFGANPEQIVALGKQEFFATIRGHAKGAKTKTLTNIFTAAEASASHNLPASVQSVRSTRVQSLHAETLYFKGEKDRAAQKMVQIYARMRKLDAAVPQPKTGVISEVSAARLLAETGPLSDFGTVNQLLRYAGLNLRERESGRWRGQTKISRRGRTRLRKVLNIISLGVVQKQRLFGTYYHGKKDVDRMPGDKAMTCVMRKFLKMFYGWYRSAAEFDERRVFACASSYSREAA